MLTHTDQTRIMTIAIREAEKAISEKNHPFGAVMVDENGKILARAHNSQFTKDRTCHAEVTLIKKASKKFKQFQFDDYYVFSTSEPCSMCMSLLIKSRIKGLYYGVSLNKDNDPYITAKELNKKAKHKMQLTGGVLKSSCEENIRKGFARLTNA